VSDFAGLWMREDGESPSLAFENMQGRGLKRTTEWTEYSIKLTVHSGARQLFFGAHLGNASPFALPGDLRTMIRGLGLFYPDKTPTQRIGIVPNIEARPTLAGIRAGRDEVLEEALRQRVGGRRTCCGNRKDGKIAVRTAGSGGTEFASNEFVSEVASAKLEPCPHPTRPSAFPTASTTTSVAVLATRPRS
jgi:hypothetical protein